MSVSQRAAWMSLGISVVVMLLFGCNLYLNLSGIRAQLAATQATLSVAQAQMVELRERWDVSERQRQWMQAALQQIAEKANITLDATRIR